MRREKCEVKSEGEGKPAVQPDSIRFLTREELAEALQVSVRTIDAMVLEEGLPHLRLKGFLVRFYLPDVVRHLTATALTAKRRWPGVLRKTPNSKLQTPEKLQAPISK